MNQSISETFIKINCQTGKTQKEDGIFNEAWHKGPVDTHLIAGIVGQKWLLSIHCRCLGRSSCVWRVGRDR